MFQSSLASPTDHSAVAVHYGHTTAANCGWCYLRRRTQAVSVHSGHNNQHNSSTQFCYQPLAPGVACMHAPPVIAPKLLGRPSSATVLKTSAAPGPCDMLCCTTIILCLKLWLINMLHESGQSQQMPCQLPCNKRTQHPVLPCGSWPHTNLRKERRNTCKTICQTTHPLQSSTCTHNLLHITLPAAFVYI